MRIPSHPNFLRGVLLADGATCLAMGGVLILGADLLSGWFGLPSLWLREAGLILLPFAIFLLLVATRRTLSRRAVWLAVACNAAWVLASAAILVGGLVAPTPLGFAFVIAQALIVGLVTELEIIGLRHIEPVPA
jgi:hypothetical protein